ncbi:MAG: Ig-like domain-containing protein [Muribaculaceae bacterium]|nr:Ig-like domain-containing protein [Roseburia sp.]MCM1431608.1 Ig-like domain-containing protein [Muribaculaceae bacterium]MCM1492073.1 Ig-like domain-containing protein [Muribaculaceae bacterium]
MKKWQGYFFGFAVALFAWILFLVPDTAFASSFSTSNYEPVRTDIRVEGRNLIFTKLPDAEQYKQCSVSLLNENENISSGKQFSKALAYEEGMTFSTEGVADGNYYLLMYRRQEVNKGSYIPLMPFKNGKVLLSISGDEIRFLFSPVYEHNLAERKNIVQANKKYGLFPDSGSDLYIEPDNKEIKKLAKDIVKGASSDYEKARLIHDWVSINICYDYEVLVGASTDSQKPSDVLKSKRAVCAGYSYLTASLLRAAGIPARVEEGYALGVGTKGKWTADTIKGIDTNHAWNEAYVDGRWIIIDTTWDSRNSYRNGEYKYESTGCDYDYFDPTVEAFSGDHKSLTYANYIDTASYWHNYKVYRPKEPSVVLSSKKKKANIVFVSDIAPKVDQKFYYKTAKFTYSSSNSSVAKVSKKGVITKGKKGKATITVSIRFNGTVQKYKIKVTVK